ncbi:MAG TPA: MOSC domain-containing protein [Candidatus Dormibacteraeota bacterium]|nr:MOSC domain-containing protein [Candidatus Dormibacteraeota bacterium]
MRVLSIHVGGPRYVEPTGDGAPWDRRWRTSFFRRPVAGPVRALRESLDGDRVADRRVHGGPDMAILAYSGDHYPFWRAELGLAEMGDGGFGENLTVSGQDEETVCIGDVYALGEAVLQVSQHRGPCYKIAWRWRRLDLLDRVIDNGRHGWYLRVLREGPIEAGQELRLVERPHPEWTVRRAADVYRMRKRRRDEAGDLARCEALAPDARAKLRRAAERGRVAGA